MAENAKIEDLIAPILQTHGAFLVDLLIRGERGTKMVELFVDTEQGISADLCAEISRELASAVETAGTFNGPYNLVVSSPGLDRPLKFVQQYRRNLGKKIAVTLKTQEGQRKVQGELVEVSSDYISIHSEQGSVEQVPMSGIVQTLVIPRW